MNRSRRAAVTLGALTLSAAALAGCGGNGADTAQSSSAQEAEIELLPKDAALAAAVPAPIKERSKLIIATDATAPPNQSIAEDGKTIIGNEVDFGNQIASVLGLEAEFVNISFDSIIPGLQAGRYDIGLSGMRDTEEREQVVDFVTYAKTGPQLFARVQDKDKLTSIEQLCGHSFALQSGTVQEQVGREQSDKCVADGKAPIDIRVFKSQADQVQAVSSGQVEVGAQNAPNNVYLEEQTDGAMVGVGEPFAEGPWGIPVPKGSGLLEPLHAATEQLVASPQYQQILEKWKVESQAIDQSVINGATS
ncbi:ABC transporter substrate-binding protein [Mycolicibacterium sp. HK-90]|uniref:ABC transporter substrate-binding protein n=1 Tax=Mycolicibacterium sp. HK-90 TaxID=3056937 RepID=UPI00265B46BE|nr:ABC transporter substrate-binding protein [Mycolicibacterium sp. HK-90]WKG03960.1 ABC transporter substrate-binding protein [Mycolicibacterium sp. HK-90]